MHLIFPVITIIALTCSLTVCEPWKLNRSYTNKTIHSFPLFFFLAPWDTLNKYLWTEWMGRGSALAGVCPWVRNYDDSNGKMLSLMFSKQLEILGIFSPLLILPCLICMVTRCSSILWLCSLSEEERQQGCLSDLFKVTQFKRAGLFLESDILSLKSRSEILLPEIFGAPLPYIIVIIVTISNMSDEH